MNRSTRDMLDHLRHVVTPVIPAAGEVTAHIAGGAAVSHNTGRQSTKKADIAWSHRVLIRPQDRFLMTRDEQGNRYLLEIGSGVPEMTHALHPDWRERAEIVAYDPGLTVTVISAADLVVSLATRLDDTAISDIRMIAEKTRVDPDIVERLGHETIDQFVGDTDHLRKNLDQVLKVLEDYAPKNEPGC